MTDLSKNNCTIPQKIDLPMQSRYPEQPFFIGCFNWMMVPKSLLSGNGWFYHQTSIHSKIIPGLGVPGFTVNLYKSKQGIASLKLTTSLHLKMDGWNPIVFLSSPKKRLAVWSSRYLEVKIDGCRYQKVA